MPLYSLKKTMFTPTLRRSADGPPGLFERIGRQYRRLLRTHHFLVFGLPFLTCIVGGSFLLTPATAVRYEKFDRKTHALDREDALGLQKTRDEGRRRGGFKGKDIREEYWRLAGQSDKLENWEPVRVKRLPGEPDGTFD